LFQIAIQRSSILPFQETCYYYLALAFYILKTLQGNRSGKKRRSRYRQLGTPKTPERDGIETNRAHALELFPFLQDLPIARTWAGWMPFTRDLRLLIGKMPHLDNLYLLTGLSSSGFEKGLMSGKLLAELINHGAEVPILSEADPAQQVSMWST